MLITGCLMMGIFGIAVVTLGILSVTMTSVGTIPSAVLGAVAGGMVIPFLAGAFFTPIYRFSREVNSASFRNWRKKPEKACALRQRIFRR